MNRLQASESQESLQKLERRSLADRIADELRDLVLLEKLAPGAPIPERETADALGVSRTPLRESLRILASEGLVEIAPNKAPRVANPSIDELRDLLLVQGALEALAGELACDSATDQELDSIAALEANMVSISDNSDPLVFFQMDMQFHQSIVAAARNETLFDTHQTYNARLWRARFISSRQRVNRSGTLQQHNEIVKALLNRDGSACAAALRNHLQAGYENIKKAVTRGANDES
ncbi:MAG: GntR family transcriptional regulator [Pseudomonadota bacterium]